MLSTICNAHFGFSESPFGSTPNPQLFYINESYREALATLTYGLEARRGFIVVTGEPGTGKTTLLRKLMFGLEPKFKTAYIFNTLVSFEGLLRLILADLGLPTCAGDKLEMIGRLNEYLLEQHKQGNVVALLIDEAQDLSLETLEELRLLTNLETDKGKLLQLALVGQPELELKLNKTQLWLLRLRAALRYQLRPLAANEVGRYIESRLHAVSQKTENLFDIEVVEKIARYSNGIPRLINNICDNALLIAYAVSKSKVDGLMIDEVAGDLLLRQAQAETTTAEPKAISRVAQVSPNAENGLAKPERALRQPSANWIACSCSATLRARAGTIKSLMAIAALPARAARALGSIAKTMVGQIIICQRNVVYSLSFGFSHLWPAKNRPVESAKHTLSSFPKIDWKPYASTMFLLFFVSLEVLYFHGAHLSLLSDSGFLSQPSLNDAVNSMFTRLDQKALNTDRPEIDNQELPSTLERKEPRRKLSSPKARRAATITSPSVPAERPSALRRNRSDSIALRSEKRTNLSIVDVSVKEVNLNEPGLASVTVQNNTSKTQLNVKWEN
jgi:type II secretory pathway predicted ATPase ExeA